MKDKKTDSIVALNKSADYYNTEYEILYYAMSADNGRHRFFSMRRRVGTCRPRRMEVYMEYPM